MPRCTCEAASSRLCATDIAVYSLYLPTHASRVTTTSRSFDRTPHYRLNCTPLTISPVVAVPACCPITCVRGTRHSWNQLGCNYDEKKIRDVADAMVSTGMLSAGYECVHTASLCACVGHSKRHHSLSFQSAIWAALECSAPDMSVCTPAQLSTTLPIFFHKAMQASATTPWDFSQPFWSPLARGGISVNWPGLSNLRQPCGYQIRIWLFSRSTHHCSWQQVLGPPIAQLSTH